ARHGQPVVAPDRKLRDDALKLRAVLRRGKVDERGNDRDGALVTQGRRDVVAPRSTAGNEHSPTGERPIGLDVLRHVVGAASLVTMPAAPFSSSRRARSLPISRARTRRSEPSAATPLPRA